MKAGDSMSEFLIVGGRRLSGEVAIHGAKNSVLPILAATVLVPGVSVIHNCPHLSDVAASLRILEHLGCRTARDGDIVTVDATALSECNVPDDLMREMRSSVIFLGAILARAGKADMNLPGGCELGPRPIDLHLSAMEALGAEISMDSDGLHCMAAEFVGREINLSLPSVGATENIMLAACGAQGLTAIHNAAREPEIVDLQNFLNAVGGRVRGAGSSTIVIEGKRPLHSGEHTVIGDRIVAATYLAAAAAAGGDVTVRGVDWRHLSTVTAAFCEAGCRISSQKDRIHIICARPLNGVSPVRTAPYPGFPTDAQAPVMAALARSMGTTVFVENMFENRYRHVDELARMGADIRVEGRVAVVCGVPRLHANRVRAADLRGGAALAVAALGAEGETVLSGLQHIDRGYECLERDLSALGAEIKRLE